ncbi:MAG: ABC transporter substrate-binding protein [Bacillota bacterium]|nr:ABC transporter substrate-binding protein [Bacillota bacterium]
MRTQLRVLSLATACVLAATMLSGCGPSQSVAGKKAKDPAAEARLANMNKEGFPIVKQPITLKFMVGRNSAQSDWASILTWPTYEKKTNIHIDWDAVLSDNLAEKRNLVLASGQNLPDAFFRCSFSTPDVQKYGADGTFLKINDYLDYMPNFKQVLDKYDDIRRGLPSVDGSIYSLPGLTDCPEIELNPKIYLNKKFMDNVGATMPKSLDDLYNTLKLMLDKDANKDGKADEVPLTSNSWKTLRNALMGAYGLMNRGSTHQNIDIDPKTNNLRFIPTAPEFRQLVEYMHKLYSEKLIDNEIFTIKSSNVTAKVEADLVGGIVHTNTTLAGNKHVDDFTGITEALQGPNGDKLWTGIRGHMSTKGSFSITKTNQYPEATARWMDYWFSDEGARLYYMGVEGESYYVTSDGKYEFIPEKVKVPEGSTYDQTVAKFTPYAGGGNPALALSKYFKGAELLPIPQKCAQDLSKFTPKEVWGFFNYTDEETNRMSSIEADMFSGFYDTAIPNFISGQTPLNDQTWADYVAKFDKMGLAEYMKIYKSGYDRYKSIK